MRRRQIHVVAAIQCGCQRKARVVERQWHDVRRAGSEDVARIRITRILDADRRSRIDEQSAEHEQRVLRPDGDENLVG